MFSDVLFFFEKHMDALPLYERLEEKILSALPDTRIKVQKTQISFSNRFGFAYVSFLPVRKAEKRSKCFMTVSFSFYEQVASPRIDAAAQTYPNRWMHHVMVQTEEEIDDQLLEWITASAAFSAIKGKRK